VKLVVQPRVLCISKLCAIVANIAHPDMRLTDSGTEEVEEMGYH
jgi:hypothetical protein